MYIVRNCEKTVEYMSERFPVVLVTGPRQVGKTTMLMKIAKKNRNYVTLDDPNARNMAINEPGLFLQRYEPPVIIDEIQYAPNLMQYIKLHVDENKKMGDIWMTGSQMFHLMKNVSDSLAGRVGILRMQGFSGAELDGYDNEAFIMDSEKLISKVKERTPKSLKEVYKMIYMGQMPGVYSRDISPDIFYGAYINTYIQRDIKELTQVADEMLFLQFLTACAARTSQMLNLADIARDIGISAPTAKQWLSILITSGIVILIEPYFNNRMKRIIKSPNLYFMDTGLCAYLTKWNNPESLETGNMSGAFFETFVVSEVIKSYQNLGLQAPICYYRDKDKREIDLIIEQNNTLYPIEIKKSASPKKEAIKHFQVLNKSDVNVGTGAVICMAKDLVPLDKDNWLVPVWLL
ncbi:MAG: ATPase [Firmicutes bacterium HGW-Firmicutes-5]|nr:MAG: ATPase [Firmicutes bacterium HGW-Firmicutes-5]